MRGIWRKPFPLVSHACCSDPRGLKGIRSEAQIEEPTIVLPSAQSLAQALMSVPPHHELALQPAEPQIVQMPMFCLTTWQYRLKDMQKVERGLHTVLLTPRAVSCMKSCAHVTVGIIR